MKRTRVFALLASLVPALLPATVDAHVTLEVREAVAGSYYTAGLQVGHGCSGSPTKSVRVQIPGGFSSVKPQPKAGWKLATVKAKLDTPLDNGHGGKITETVREVVWSGGRLLDEHFDVFVLRAKLPEKGGDVIYFPVVQECEKGVNRWIEIPAAGKSRRDLKQPAAELKLLPKPQ